MNDQEYLMRLPPDKVVAISLRVGYQWDIHRLHAVKRALQPTKPSGSSWDRLVYVVFHLVLEARDPLTDMTQANSNHLISLLQWNELHGEETIWFLNTLSDLRSCTYKEQENRELDWVYQMRYQTQYQTRKYLGQEYPSFTGICLGILSWQAPKWSDGTSPDIVLLEAVVAFAAISCSSDGTYRRKILNNTRQYPWLLLNLRSPDIFSRMIKDAPKSCHKQLISLLFLVCYALLWRKQRHLAAQYLAIITEKNDFHLYISALTTIAPAIGDIGLSTIGGMLMAPRTRFLTLISNDYIQLQEHYFQEEWLLLNIYDRRLGDRENPDPNMFAMLLLLAKQLPSSVVKRLHHLDLNLKNPWLKLAARVIARLDIPDGSSMNMGSFHDHRVHNMIAALSMRRYADAKPTHYTESLLLASFLESRELAVSSLALGYYIQTILSYSDPSAPSYCVSGAVHAVFNLLLPDHQLQMGWNILDMFVNGFEKLSVEWRRTFAEAFFTLSRRPWPKLRGDRETSTAESELERILTWGYFHEEERESEFTDSEFSGLDWMVMAWSFHFLQQSGTMVEGSTSGEVRPQDSSAPMVNEGFVLCALCKLLDAAPYHQIIPIIPKLREFVQWFEHAELPEYHHRIEARIEDVDHKRQEYQMFHTFHAFNCMWYI